MNIPDALKHTQSYVKSFYSRYPDFTPESELLKIPSALRWFKEMRHFGFENDYYNYQEIVQGKSLTSKIIRNRPFITMSSYDYLGLIGNSEIEAAASDAIFSHGTGTGGVRLLTGTNNLHCQLEERISAFMGSQSSMVVSSGYMANITAIAGLYGKNDLILTDENIHRSIIDAMKISGSEVKFFKHNSPSSLENLLGKNAKKRRKLIVVEGIYSMDGDISPLPEIVKLKKEFNASLMVDEAHSLGVLGENGRGITECFGVDPDDIDIFTGSLSKAIPSNGGFIVAKDQVIMYLKHGGAPYMFSGALSPANTAASIKALEIVETQKWRIKRMWENTHTLQTLLTDGGVNTGFTKSPVIPVICSSKDAALKLSNVLFEAGYLATAVVYPAVPRSKPRLRVCCSAGHTPEIIDDFAKKVIRAYKEIERC